MGSREPFPCSEPLSFVGAPGVLEALDNGITSLLFNMVSNGVAFLKDGTDLTCLCNFVSQCERHLAVLYKYADGMYSRRKFR